MKRPSGFDRAPDPRRPESELPSTPAPQAAEAAAAPEQETARARLSLFTRRAATTDRRQRDEGADIGADATQATAPSQTGGPSAVEAETLDLSAAAQSGGHADAGELAAVSATDVIEPVAAEASAPTGAVADDAVTDVIAADVVEAGGAAAGGAAAGVAGGVGQAETVELGSAIAVPEAGEAAQRGVRGALARFRADRAADPVRAAEQRVREASKLVRTRRRRETRRFSAHARRRRRNWFIALGTVAALAAFVAIGAFTPIMAVRDVQIVGAQSVNEADVRQALARFDGVPLALVDTAEVHQALEPFPLIQRYAVELVPPQTLVVRIEERVAVVSIPKDGGGVTLHDAAGVLVGAAEAPPAGVPLAGGSVTDTDSAAFRSAASALRDMPVELRNQVVAVAATSAQDVTLTLSNGIAVIWGDAAQTKRKSVILQTILGSLGERPVTQIDVSSTEAPVFR